MKKGAKKFYKNRRRTPTQAMRHWLKPYKPTTPTSMEDFHYERDLARLSRTKPHRAAIGLVRAFGSPFYFHGAYVGAEND